VHDAEAGGFRARHLEAADRDVGTALDMLSQHHLVVHLVDVVAGEKNDEFAGMRLDDVDVLIDRIGRAEVPHRLRDALAGGEDVKTLIALGAKEVPAHLQMPDQAVGLVLRRDRDAANTRIHGIGKGKIDDARFAAKVDRGFGAPVGQLQKPAATAAGQNEGKRLAGERLVSDTIHLILPRAFLSGAPSDRNSSGRDDNSESSILVPILAGPPGGTPMPGSAAFAKRDGLEYWSGVATRLHPYRTRM